jgi:hypothetical protein
MQKRKVTVNRTVILELEGTRHECEQALSALYCYSSTPCKMRVEFAGPSSDELYKAEFEPPAPVAAPPRAPYIRLTQENLDILVAQWRSHPTTEPTVISCIKLIRELTGCTLKAGKDYVERNLEDFGFGPAATSTAWQG